MNHGSGTAVCRTRDFLKDPFRAARFPGDPSRNSFIGSVALNSAFRFRAGFLQTRMKADAPGLQVPFRLPSPRIRSSGKAAAALKRNHPFHPLSEHRDYGTFRSSQKISLSWTLTRKS